MQKAGRIRKVGSGTPAFKDAVDPGALRSDERALGDGSAAAPASPGRPGGDRDHFCAVVRQNRTAGIAGAAPAAFAGRILRPNEDFREGRAHLQRRAAKNARACSLAFATDAIAEDAQGLPDGDGARLVQFSGRESRVERRLRPDESQIDRDDASGERVGAKTWMRGDRPHFDKNRLTGAVPIMNAHIPGGGDAMGGRQDDLRRDDDAGAEAGLIDASLEHHDDMGRKTFILARRPDKRQRIRGARAGARSSKKTGPRQPPDLRLHEGSRLRGGF